MEQKAIRNLILGDAFELYGQPKWTFGKNTCNTYEVFAERLRLESGEVIPAWPIVELIEQDAELTSLFSDWFLHRAMELAVSLTQETDCNILLSLNLLPLYADRADCVEKLLGFLKATGLSPAKLQLEISEAQSLTDKGIENLNQLHDGHEIGLWLANFGTGHSNIDLLREVHFDGLELDRSYAESIPAHEQTCRLAVAIVQLAHTMDIQVCAKGIENQDQFEFFEELDCLKGQGYLIGKPMKGEELRDYIRKYAVKRSKNRA